MRKLNLIFQEVLKFLFIFMLSFIWIRFFLRKLWLATLTSFLLSVLIWFVIFAFKKKKGKNQWMKLKEKEDAENMFLSLCCSSSPMVFFEKLASKKHENISKHKKYIIINHEKEKVKTLLYFFKSFEGLNIAKFMEIYSEIKKEKATKIIICCKSVADKQVMSFCENFNEKYLILDEYLTYQKLYKYYDVYPEMTHKYKKEKKLVFKDFLAYSFNKKRTKGYLFSAFILLLSGLFVRTTIYYCIVASLLVVSAIVCQFNPYFNTKSEPDILWCKNQAKTSHQRR